MHILVAERGTEKFLAANDVRPLRICYEDMMALGADGIIDVITKHIGIPELPRGSWQSSHEKLGTSQNQNFAKRFREEEAEFISDIERERAPMLVGLNDISNFSY